MPQGMEWAELPKDGRTRTNWPAIAQALRANPGAWAKVEGAEHVAMSIRRGRLQAFRPVGHFEATLRQGQVFARYVGESND